MRKSAAKRWLATRFNEGVEMADVDRLVDLLDVLLTNPQNGDVLKYNGTKWVNGNNGSTPFSGAMVSGMDQTNPATPGGQFLTVCPTVIFDTDGYVDNSDPTETAIVAPFDGVFLVTWNVALVSGGGGMWIELFLANGGPDTNAKTTFNTDSGDDPVWASLHQIVHLHAGDPIFATIIYSGATEAVRAIMGVDEPTGQWAITKLGDL